MKATHTFIKVNKWYRLYRLQALLSWSYVTAKGESVKYSSLPNIYRIPTLESLMVSTNRKRLPFIICTIIMIGGILTSMYSFFPYPQAIAQSTTNTLNTTAELNATTVGPSPREGGGNLTSSVDLASGTIEFAKNRVTISLSRASEIATNHLGIDSFVYSALLDTENGYLFYEIVGVDANNRAHLIIVDPGTGSVIRDRELGKLLRPFS